MTSKNYKPFRKSGELTKRALILVVLFRDGEQTKKNLIKKVWGKSSEWFKKNEGVLRGWNCSTFREMAKDDLIGYNKKINKWYITFKGLTLLDLVLG